MGNGDDKRVAQSASSDAPAPKKARSTVVEAENIPSSHHYHVSWMHSDIVTVVVSSEKHGFVITASRDGVVKFWKRLPVTRSYNSEQQDKKRTVAPCLEFCKSYVAHTAPVSALAMDVHGDCVASVANDGVVKYYDVGSFDVSSYHRTNLDLGTSACWISLDASVLAVSSRSSGHIFVFTPHHGGSHLQTLTLHGSNVVTSIVYNPVHNCAMSCDTQGIIEFWGASVTQEGDDSTLDEPTVNGDGQNEVGITKLRVGGPVGASHGFNYASKAETHLHRLLKKKTYVIAACLTRYGGSDSSKRSKEQIKYALYCADHRIRILDHSSGEFDVTFDERLSSYENDLYSKAPYRLDAIEYGQRAAIEKEISEGSTLFSAGITASGQRSQTPQRLSLTFDPSGRYLIYPTIMGLKCLDWSKKKLFCLTGKADASQVRFTGVCLAAGNAKANIQLQLARGDISFANRDREEAKEFNDSLLIATAYNQRRLYVFSHVDPSTFKKGSGEEASWIKRDQWNEAPNAQDAQFHRHQNGGGASENREAVSRAILRTTAGDIHIDLFSKLVPRTFENFTGLVRRGSYDGVIFHRVIKQFMLQTGDFENQDGTGGESVWGGEFEDEFVRELRHDRPFVVSMANAGPNTNGSQFFITTVAAPWLDNKHTIFGRVSQGFDVVSAIENCKTNDLDKPLEDIMIRNVDLV